jgi:6-pyruvoyl-tetrahydropterin synthase
MKYYSTKTYGNDRGLSCCFRQWRSTHSHCSTIHGYSIGIKLVFESETLDDRNWVFDFGNLKVFKDWSEYMFDHTLVVAEDDPHLDFFKAMAEIKSTEKPVMIYESPDGGVTVKSRAIGYHLKKKPHEMGAICDLRIVEAVGCEKFAELAYTTMTDILNAFKLGREYVVDGKSYTTRYPVGMGVRLKSAEVFEHAGNSAIYEG